jgi:hypothetical protein
MSHFWAEKIAVRFGRMIFVMCLLGCSPKPPIAPPDAWQGDAGACAIHWAKACQNATEHGLGASFPGGCGQDKAEEHCR